MGLPPGYSRLAGEEPGTRSTSRFPIERRGRRDRWDSSKQAACRKNSSLARKDGVEGAAVDCRARTIVVCAESPVAESKPPAACIANQQSRAFKASPAAETGPWSAAAESRRAGRGLVGCRGLGRRRAAATPSFGRGADGRRAGGAGHEILIAGRLQLRPGERPG